MLKKISEFLKYWYFRYLMVTELYMVEKWERAVMNTFVIILLALLSYFNWSVTLKMVGYFLSGSYKNSIDDAEDTVKKMNMFSDVSILSGDLGEL